MKIELHVERLLLDGLPVTPHEATLVQAAVEFELGRLVGAGRLDARLAAGAAVPLLHGERIPALSTAGPDGIGTQIAAAIYAGMGERK